MRGILKKDKRKKGNRAGNLCAWKTGTPVIPYINSITHVYHSYIMLYKISSEKKIHLELYLMQNTNCHHRRVIIIIVDEMPCLRAYALSATRTRDPLITSQEHEPIYYSAST